MSKNQISNSSNLVHSGVATGEIDLHLTMGGGVQQNGNQDNSVSGLQDKIDAIVSESERGNNLFYGLGRALRMVWDSLPSFGLPVAAAKTDEVLRLDDEFEKVLASSVVRFDFDAGKSYDGLRRRSKRRFDEVRDNVLDEFRRAASEGPETRDLMIQCLNRVNVEILDAEESKDRIAYWQSILGKSFFGAFDPENSRLILMSNFGGKSTLETIIHECGHVREIFEGITYDESKMQDCFNNLKQLNVKMIQCLDRGKIKEAGDCEEVKKMAEEWRYRSPLILRSFTKFKAGETSLDGRVTIARNDATMPKLSNRGAVVKYTCDTTEEALSSLCTIELDSTQDLRSGKRSVATSKAKTIFSAAAILSEIDPLDKTRSFYTQQGSSAAQAKGEDMVLREQHATITQSVPGAVIRQVCPDGFGEKKLINARKPPSRSDAKDGGAEL